MALMDDLERQTHSHLQPQQRDDGRGIMGDPGAALPDRGHWIGPRDGQHQAHPRVSTLEEIEQRRADREAVHAAIGATRVLKRAGASSSPREGDTCFKHETDSLSAFSAAVAPRRPLQAGSFDPHHARLAALEARVAELERIVAAITIQPETT